MALEPAGVSLQAQNFADYIKKLDRIDKAQQEIFNATAQITGKSFDEVSKAAKKYERELKDVANAQKKAAQEARKLEAAQRTARAAQQQAFISAGNVVLDFAKKIGTVAIESGKLAAQFEGQRTGLNNLAASFGQSGTAIQASIQKASRGTLSGLQSINAANQALLLGVAKTPAEFDKLTSTALTLGRTVGLTGTQAIEQFTTALGRQSLLILDNFGISAKQVNAEMERLAQVDFGRARSQLSEAEKSATFMKAALQIAGEAAATIGEEAGNAQASFERLNAASEDLQVTFGALVGALGVGISDALTRAAKTAQQFFSFLGAGFTGAGTIAKGVFAELGIAISRLGQLIKGEISFAEFNQPLREFSDILDEAGLAAIDRFKEIASTIEGVSFDDNEIVSGLERQEDAIEDNTEAIKAYESALKQAQNLQLAFAREGEDAARKLARANEDVARKQARTVAKLQERQAKDRDKLLKDQQKQLDNFESDRAKQISRAENEIRKERRQASEQRKRDQAKLQRELQQAQERFNLSQLQSERRFSLSERRLRAEGDILAIQQLREDRELERQEEKENFEQGKKEQISSAKERQREQTKDLESRLKELKSDLEDRRAELLRSFDEQLRSQQEAQREAQANQQRAFEEQAIDRQIALQREEEDRRISQGRQLEDLGRSLAEQQGVTAEGTAKIAGELEKVFGQEGVADNIVTGFTKRTENDFKDLFENIEKIVSEAEIEPKIVAPRTTTRTSAGGFGGRIGGIPEFQEGGIVPGPLGSPQIVQAHAGETILPTHQRSFQAIAPVIPSQSLEVLMSGGFNITGGEQAGEAAVQAAVTEMTETMQIAIRRLARKN